MGAISIHMFNTVAEIIGAVAKIPPIGKPAAHRIGQKGEDSIVAHFVSHIEVVYLGRVVIIDRVAQMALGPAIYRQDYPVLATA